MEVLSRPRCRDETAPFLQSGNSQKDLDFLRLSFCTFHSVPTRKDRDAHPLCSSAANPAVTVARAWPSPDNAQPDACDMCQVHAHARKHSVFARLTPSDCRSPSGRHIRRHLHGPRRNSTNSACWRRRKEWNILRKHVCMLGPQASEVIRTRPRG